MSLVSVIEFNDKGDFAASHAAVNWLRELGFSIGSMQAGSPRAIWYGDCYISKWRGLSTQDKREMHARMEGDDRNGPLRITLLAAASPEARAAFERGVIERAAQLDSTDKPTGSAA